MSYRQGPEAPRKTSIPPPPATLFASTNFVALGLSPDLVSALSAMHMATPTVIHARKIPALLGGADFVVGAATGSGKTLSYLLPFVQQLKNAEALADPSATHEEADDFGADDADAAQDDVSRAFDEFSIAPSLRMRHLPRAILLVPTRESPTRSARLRAPSRTRSSSGP